MTLTGLFFPFPYRWSDRNDSPHQRRGKEKSNFFLFRLQWKVIVDIDKMMKRRLAKMGAPAAAGPCPGRESLFRDADFTFLVQKDSAQRTIHVTSFSISFINNQDKWNRERNTLKCWLAFAGIIIDFQISVWTECVGIVAKASARLYIVHIIIIRYR